MRRKTNTGRMSGMNRFRHSRFEEESHPASYAAGVTRRTANTLSGPYEENRGRRSGGPEALAFEKSPFEDGREDNWSRREGWDEEFNRRRQFGGRKHGGGIIEDTSRHAGAGPRGYRRSNESIYEDVCEILTRDPDVDASQMEVEVSDGIVSLRGIVSSRAVKKMAEYLIENVSGVKDVHNLLRFSREGELQ